MRNTEHTSENNIRITPVAEWKYFKGRPLIMAGPCSAESEEQVMETARLLHLSGRVDIFRAGIWKPRTRPNSFEGVGAGALRWLRQVKDEFDMPVAVEVATEKHVYESLKYGIDVLWIGARTTVNPFAMQEIADALRGVDVTVMVKNPINPETDLWIGAIERIHRAGIRKLAAIHRGFSSFEKSIYRNQPRWQIPIDLRQRIPEIPLICDPSHMGGSRSLLHDLSQKSMDLNYDGLMIESHFNPETALSDRKQQITPAELETLLGNIVLRKSTSADTAFVSMIEDLRNQIDIYDDQLLDILESRMVVADSIGHYKKEHNITILQSNRWKEILNKAVARGEQRGLSRGFVTAVLEAIHQESINHQMKIMNGD